MRFQMKCVPGSLSSRDKKKFDAVFVSHGPGHPNLRDEDRTGCLGDCQIEIPEASHWQHQCAAEFAPALRQVQGDPWPTGWKLSVVENRTMT